MFCDLHAPSQMQVYKGDFWGLIVFFLLVSYCLLHFGWGVWTGRIKIRLGWNLKKGKYSYAGFVMFLVALVGITAIVVVRSWEQLKNISVGRHNPAASAQQETAPTPGGSPDSKGTR